MVSLALTVVASRELPEILASIRFALREAFPDAPPPDDVEILAALIDALCRLYGGEDVP